MPQNIQWITEEIKEKNFKNQNIDENGNTP